MNEDTKKILDNYKEIIKQIETLKESKNITRDICLLPVSKTKTYEEMKILKDNGYNLFGENYVQEILEKHQIDEELKFHMIGHLQSNKVKYIIDKVNLIESVDSLKLAEVIDKEASKKSLKIDILLEINVAKEDTKYGFQLEEIDDVLEEISKMKNIKVCGLMTSTPYTNEPETNRIYFATLKNEFDRIKEESNIDMKILSMGMSNDYKIAIEEGSTEIRIGTNIFGKRDYKI